MLSSTSIEVMWVEVNPIDLNGVFTEYEVLYNPLRDFNGQISSSSDRTSFLNTTITGLQEFVNYNISVRAYTRRGNGPYSNAVDARTMEDGELHKSVLTVCLDCSL